MQLHTTSLKKKSFFNRFNKEVIVSIITYLFVLLWLYAATNKLLDFQKFTVQVGQSPILTEYAVFVAWTIPTIEILLAIMLVINRTLMTALYGSFGLMLMFTTYIIGILSFAERVPCSCGGILEKMGWTEHLIFNIAFTLLGLLAVVLQMKINESKDK